MDWEKEREERTKAKEMRSSGFFQGSSLADM